MAHNFRLYLIQRASAQGVHQGNLLTAVRGGATATLTYNKAGRKLTLDDPDMGDWSYTYDALGNLKVQTDARGCVTTLSYDGLNRLTGKIYSGSCNNTVDVSYTYDAFVSGSNYGRGYRTGMTDASGSTTWVYDPRGRATEELKAVGSDSFKTQWGYNSNDSVAWMRYPADNTGALGEQVNYSYHPQGWLNTAVNNSGYSYVQATSYDAAGRVELRTLGASVLQTDYVYFGWTVANGQGRLKRLFSGTPAQPSSLQDLRYYDTGSGAAWYDSVGNLLQIADYKAGPQTQAFTYDEADRILSGAASGGGGSNYSESYTYNGATGNLASKAGVTYTYGDAAHKHAVTSTSNGNSYGYDANGNLTSRNIGGTAYTLAYDAENHLSGVSGGATATFVYDGDGRRVKATISGVTTVYIGDYFEWMGSTSTMIKYFSTNGRRIAMRVGATRYFLLSDHLGSTTITAKKACRSSSCTGRGRRCGWRRK